MPGSSSHGATTFRGDTNYHQSSSSPQAPLGTGDQYSHHHNHHNRHPHPHYKAVPTPLYVDVRAGSTSDIGGIQNQVEAALYAHSSEQRRSEKTMNYALEATLRSRLAATSSGLQQLREEEVPSGGASAAMPFEKDLLSPSLSANSPLGDRAQIGKAQAELHWAGDVMGRGRSKENGEVSQVLFVQNIPYGQGNEEKCKDTCFDWGGELATSPGTCVRGVSRFESVCLFLVGRSSRDTNPAFLLSCPFKRSACARSCDFDSYRQSSQWAND